jgi:hypothetical protein
MAGDDENNLAPVIVQPVPVIVQPVPVIVQPVPVAYGDELPQHSPLLTRQNGKNGQNCCQITQC